MIPLNPSARFRAPHDEALVGFVFSLLCLSVWSCARGSMRLAAEGMPLNIPPQMHTTDYGC